MWYKDALFTTGPLVLPTPAEDGGGVEGAALQLEQEHPLAQVGGVGEEELGGRGDDDVLVLLLDLEFADDDDPLQPLEAVWLLETASAEAEGVFDDTTAGADIWPDELIVGPTRNGNKF